MPAVAKQVGISTFVGPPQEARAVLSDSDAKSVLVVTFDRVSISVLQALEKTVSSLASSMVTLVDQEAVVVLESPIPRLLTPSTDAPTLSSAWRLLQYFSSQVSPLPYETEGRAQGPEETTAPPSSRWLREAKMHEQARQAVLNSGDWLTAAQVAELAKLSARNPSAQPNKWKKKGQIFAIQHNGADLFPAYGLDPAAQYRPVKALMEIIKILAERKDSWRMAIWFCSGNSFLGGARPQDLLLSQPDRVIAAAKDEIEEIAHG